MREIKQEEESERTFQVEKCLGKSVQKRKQQTCISAQSKGKLNCSLIAGFLAIHFHCLDL